MESKITEVLTETVNFIKGDYQDIPEAPSISRQLQTTVLQAVHGATKVPVARNTSSTLSFFLEKGNTENFLHA